jgi:hypothetical protein
MPVLQLFSKQSYMNRVKTLCRNTTIILVVLSSTIVLAQKRDKKTEFNKFVDNYYEEGLLFNPIAATQEATTGTTIYCQTILPYLQKTTRLHHKISKTVKAFDNNNSFDKIAFDIMSLH